MAPDPERERSKGKLHSVFSRILKRPASDSHSNTIVSTPTSTPTSTSISTCKVRTKVAEPFPLTKMTPSMNKMFSSKPPNTAQESLITRFYDPDTRAPDIHGRTLENILDWPDTKLESSHNYIQILFPLPEGSPYNYSAPIVDRQVMETFHARLELRNRLKRALVRILSFYGFEGVSEAEIREREKVRAIEESKKEQEIDAPKTPSDAEEPAVQQDAVSSGIGMASDNEIKNIVPQDDSSDTQPTTPKPSPGLLSGFIILRAPHFPTASRNWAVRMDHNHLRISRILRCLRVLGLEKECEAYYSALQDVYNDPKIRIGERSMEYWTKAAKQDLWIAPDGEECNWLKTWVKEQASAAEKKDDEDEDEDEDEDGRVSKKAKVETTEDTTTDAE